jgi:uncharacterized membrane protein (UPF0127 family)
MSRNATDTPIYNRTQNNIIAQHAVRADNPWTRMKGLLGRKSLSPQEALIISPCQSVHMLFMKFAIDVVFVDQHQRVVGLCADLKPFAFSPVFWKSACAIELETGTIKETNVCLGDQLSF